MTPSRADESQVYFLAAMLKDAAMRPTPHEERPEHVSGDPRRHHPGYDLRSREMFCAEHSDGNRDKHRAKSDDLIQPLLLDEILPDRAQADSQNDGPAEVG